MTVRITPLATAGLAGLAGLNAWLLALALEEGPRAEAPAQIATADQASGSLASRAAPPAGKPISAYGQTVGRPLFFKARTPYVPPPPAPPPTPKPAAMPHPAPVDPGLVLGGIVILEETKKAYVLNKKDRRGAWVSEGEAILGWTVESIDAITAKLRQSDRSIELQLYPTR
jgi:hypothetical protein